MRLNPHELSAIKNLTLAFFGPDAQVRLFGSRTQASARGGDIDLLVTTPQAIERPALLSAKLAAQLQMALGEQRIDVVLEAPNLLQLPIHRVAHTEGVLL